MAEMISPGVYLEEIDNSGIVTGASSNVAVFSGNFKKGPIGTFVQVSNTQELIDNFGYPDNENYNEWFQCYNFLQYGKNLLVSRAGNINGSKQPYNGALVVDSEVTVVTQAHEDATHAHNEFGIAASAGIAGNTVQVTVEIDERRVITQGAKAYNKYCEFKQEGVRGNDFIIKVTGSSGNWDIVLNDGATDVWQKNAWNQNVIQATAFDNPFVTFKDSIPITAGEEALTKGVDGVYEDQFKVKTYVAGSLKETQNRKQTTDECTNNNWVKFLPGRKLRIGAFPMVGGRGEVPEISAVDLTHVVLSRVDEIRVDDIISFGDLPDRYFVKAIDLGKKEIVLDHEMPPSDSTMHPQKGDQVYAIKMVFGGSNEAVDTTLTEAEEFTFNGKVLETNVPRAAGDKYDLFDTNPQVSNFQEWDEKSKAIRFSNGHSKIKIVSRNPGTWCNKLQICIAKPESFAANDMAMNHVPRYAFPGMSVDDLFEYAPKGSQIGLIVYDSAAEKILETYTVDMDPKAKDEAGKSTFIENIVNKNSPYIYIKVNDANENEVADFTYVYDDIEDQYIGASIELKNASDSPIQMDDLMDGYSVFSNKEELDLDIVIANELDGAKSAIDLAETRKDCICFIGANYDDVVNKKSAQATVNLINWRKFDLNKNSMFLCATGNYKYMYDPYSDSYRWVNIAGDIAGLRAQTSSGKAAWWASAGLERGQLKGAAKIAFSPNQEQRDQLYKYSINPVVSFPGQGVVMWGQKTLLDKASSFDRVNVRSLFNYLERSLSKMAKYQIMEFNDSYTRNRIVSMIKPFLATVQSGRGIQDYKVICDESNNTPTVIANNQLVVDIMVQPTYVAEKILLRFTNSGTNSFSAVTSA